MRWLTWYAALGGWSLALALIVEPWPLRVAVALVALYCAVSVWGLLRALLRAQARARALEDVGGLLLDHLWATGCPGAVLVARRDPDRAPGTYNISLHHVMRDY